MSYQPSLLTGDQAYLKALIQHVSVIDQLAHNELLSKVLLM